MSKGQSTVHMMFFPIVLHHQSSFFPLKVQQTRQLRGIGEKCKRAPARQRQSRRQRHSNINAFLFPLSLVAHYFALLECSIELSQFTHSLRSLCFLSTVVSGDSSRVASHRHTCCPNTHEPPPFSTNIPKHSTIG